LTTANAFWLEQHDHDSRLDVGDLALHDTSKPYDSRALPGTGSMVLLSFPKSALPLRPKRLEGLLARAVRAETGMSAILARCLTSIASAVTQDEIAEADHERLGAVALDLATATLAALIDAQDQLAPETRQQALLSSIEAFIEHGLGDPDLTPGSATSGWSAAAPTWPTRGYSHIQSTPSAHVGACVLPPSSAAPSAPNTACPRANTANTHWPRAPPRKHRELTQRQRTRDATPTTRIQTPDKLGRSEERYSIGIGEEL
jgi:hypothetical protein